MYSASKVKHPLYYFLIPGRNISEHAISLSVVKLHKYLMENVKINGKCENKRDIRILLEIWGFVSVPNLQEVMPNIS